MFLKKIAVIFIFSMISMPAFSVDTGNALTKSPLYKAAIKEHSEGNYKKEIKTIEKIEKLEGKSAATCIMKYRAYIELDMEELAKAELQKALEYDKDCYDAHFALAVLAVENDDPSNARKYFKNALEINPKLKDSPELLYWYSKICAIDNDLPSALNYILKAIEIDPNENNYYLELGKIYLFKKDYIKAVNALSFAMGKNSETNAECYNYLGLIQYRRKSYNKAKEYFEKAHAAAPDNIMYLHNLMLCAKSMGEKSLYQTLMIKSSNITPKTPLDYIHLSQIAHDKSDYMNADKILQDGIKKFPDNLMLKQAVKKLNKS